jgi:hypothetical protein
MSCIGGCFFINFNMNDLFFLESGVRQGDCISSLVFNLCIDPLLNCFASHVEGLRLLEIKILALAYADDITIFTKSLDQHNLCWEIINNFCMVSGLSVNKHKSLSVGKKHSHLTHVTEFKYLGISYSDNSIDWPLYAPNLTLNINSFMVLLKGFTHGQE